MCMKVNEGEWREMNVYELMQISIGQRVTALRLGAIPVFNAMLFDEREGKLSYRLRTFTRRGNVGEDQDISSHEYGRNFCPWETAHAQTEYQDNSTSGRGARASYQTMLPEISARRSLL